MACHDVDGADRTLSPNRRPAPRSYPRQAAAVVALQAECAKLAEEELPLRVAYERFL